MSGGHFEYKQFVLNELANRIQEELDKQGVEKPKPIYDWEEPTYQTYPEEIQQIFKDAVKALKIAQIYVHRVDWYLSGDDGEESLKLCLNKDLEQLNKEY